MTALVADIGGTNARFARVDAHGRPVGTLRIETRGHPDFAAAIAHYLDAQPDTVALEAAAVCAAGPVEDGSVRMTNCPWTVSVETIAAATGVARPILVNDFTAVAQAIPALREEERRMLGGAPPDPDAAVAVLGPGTGLGVSGLLPASAAGGARVPLQGEGGHASLAAGNAREWAVIEAIAARFGHASAERAISGQGLENVYRALAEVDGARPATAPAERIAAAAHAASDARAVEAVSLFTGWLGSFAGDLALTLGARGGVYVAGGIVPAWGEAFDAVRFRERFMAKGRYRAWLERVPAWVVTARDPGLLGLARLVSQRA